MRLFRSADKVRFAEDKSELAFNKLANNSPLKNSINKAIKDLKDNAFCGERIPQKIIPKDYTKKYKIDNLWWYPLADAWRLVYSLVTPSNIEIIAVIIDYSNHKDYERRFGYK
ncbi:MAG: hypothetical protein AABW73_04950 [Nanoarchaeota archaeon]